MRILQVAGEVLVALWVLVTALLVSVIVYVEASRKYRLSRIWKARR